MKMIPGTRNVCPGHVVSDVAPPVGARTWPRLRPGHPGAEEAMKMNPCCLSRAHSVDVATTTGVRTWPVLRPGLPGAEEAMMRMTSDDSLCTEAVLETRMRCGRWQKSDNVASVGNRTLAAVAPDQCLIHYAVDLAKSWGKNPN